MRFSMLLLLLPGALGAGEKEKAERPLGRKITVGKETTYVTEPLDKEGNVDYVAALNDRLGKKVAPKDNVAAAIWQIFGPKPEGGRAPALFYKRLGIEEPAEKGDYFLDLSPYLKKHAEIDPAADPAKGWEDLDVTHSRPWKAKEYPHISGWLLLNKSALDRAVEAMKRPHYYSPLIPYGDDKTLAPLVSGLLPAVQKCRSLSNALVSRGMLSLAEGKRDAAWQDFLTVHRLGRHLTHGATLIEVLVGIAIEHIANGAELTYLEEAKLDGAAIQACRRHLAGLPPRAPLVDSVDWSERLIVLDLVQFGRQRGMGAVRTILPDLRIPEGIDFDAAVKDLDWDTVLKIVNRAQDRLVEAMRVKDRKARVDAMAKLDVEWKERREKLADTVELIRALSDPAKKATTVGEAAVVLFLPSLRKVQEASDRAEQIIRNLDLAFALAAFRVAEGSYPKTLDALTPKHIAAVPHDYFSGKAMIYRPSKDGYLLYSVGPNGKDDGGRFYDDDPPGDDPHVRMPRAAAKETR